MVRLVSAGLVVAAVVVIARGWLEPGTLALALALLLIAPLPLTAARKLLQSVVGQEFTKDRLGFSSGKVK